MDFEKKLNPALAIAMDAALEGWHAQEPSRSDQRRRGGSLDWPQEVADSAMAVAQALTIHHPDLEKALMVRASTLGIGILMADKGWLDASEVERKVHYNSWEDARDISGIPMSVVKGFLHGIGHAGGSAVQSQAAVSGIINWRAESMGAKRRALSKAGRPPGELPLLDKALLSRRNQETSAAGAALRADFDKSFAHSRRSGGGDPALADAAFERSRALALSSTDMARGNPTARSSIMREPGGGAWSVFADGLLKGGALGSALADRALSLIEGRSSILTGLQSAAVARAGIPLLEKLLGAVELDGDASPRLQRAFGLAAMLSERGGDAACASRSARGVDAVQAAAVERGGLQAAPARLLEGLDSPGGIAGALSRRSGCVAREAHSVMDWQIEDAKRLYKLAMGSNASCWEASREAMVELLSALDRRHDGRAAQTLRALNDSDLSRLFAERRMQAIDGAKLDESEQAVTQLISGLEAMASMAATPVEIRVGRLARSMGAMVSQERGAYRSMLEAQVLRSGVADEPAAPRAVRARL